MFQFPSFPPRRYLPLPGYFSPFPHGTSALSVVYVYLALRGGPRRFTPVFTVPVLLGKSDRSLSTFRVQGSYLLWPAVPKPFHYASDW